VLRIFADDAYNAFALDHLALVANLLDGCSNFHHIPRCGSSVAVQDAPASKVVGRQFHKNPVTRKNLDVVHPDLSGNRGQDFMPAFKTDLEHGIGQVFGNNALNLDSRFLLRLIFRRLRRPGPTAPGTPTAGTAAPGTPATGATPAGTSCGSIPSTWSTCHRFVSPVPPNRPSQGHRHGRYGPRRNPREVDPVVGATGRFRTSVDYIATPKASQIRWWTSAGEPKPSTTDKRLLDA